MFEADRGDQRHVVAHLGLELAAAPATVPALAQQLSDVVSALPDEVQREGLDAFERIGEEICEVVERRPASMVVVRICRPKFVRKDRKRDGETKVEIAPTVELPIERGMAGPGLLADTAVRRFGDHQPLNRLAKMYAREGMHLPRSTICGWHERLAALLMPYLKTYDIFISHAWTYNAEYYKLVEMLNGAPNFKWRNYSVPEHDPLAGGRQLASQLKRKIRPVNVSLILEPIS